MKSKIPTKAYGGATEAQYKQYGLRLPRTWKVMTSTLLLLFTFAIGQMWGTATNFHDFVAAGDTIIDIEGTGSTPSTKMSTINGTDWAAVSTSAKNNSIYRMDPSTEEVATSKTNVYGTKLGSSAKSTYKVTGVSNVIFYVGTGTASRIAKLDVTENGKSKVSEAASVTLSDKNNAYKMSYTLDASKSYTLEAYASSDIFCYAVKFTVASKCTKPGTPTALAAGSVTHNSASLSWTAGANNDGHKIYIEKKSDKTKVLDWTDATSPYAASGLDPETTYTFKVKAKGATGYCDFGDEASADFTTDVDPSATTYKVTLVPAGGTITDATGWTLNAGNYEREVSDGAELTLPAFTKTNRTFKTWRKSGPVDVTSPITVTADVTLTAVWTATVEQVLYSWEGGSPATEVGGTAVTKAQDGSDAETSDINVDAIGTNATYKAIKVQGKISSNAWSGNYIQITTDEAVKTGDKVKITACTTKGDTSKKGSAQIRLGTSATGTQIVSDGGTYNDIAVASDVPVPNTKTFTITATEINTNLLSMTRQSTNTNCWVTKLQIVRETQVEEGDLLTVTFNTNGGSAIAPVLVASGQAVAKPADPTKAHNRFKEWQLAGSAYNFSTPVTANITLVANWTPLYTVTYAANGGSGTMTDANEYAAGDEVTLLANTFDAPDASHIWDSWAVTDASDNPVAVSEGKFAMPNSAATVTAQWATISDFDVKFFQGYGDPDVQIGTTQTVSTGNFAVAPADPERAGFVFLGWSYDATEAHIVDVATYGITAATNFTAMWKAVWTVTFDGAGAVNVGDGEAVASPNSPVMAGKVFQGWYNAEVKYDFSAAVTGNLALTSKWADADPNHYVYAYNDDFHFDGVVYKTPEGAVDGGSGTSNIPMTTPYTLFAGAEGITSIVMTDGIYDSKTGAIQTVTALMKVNNNATSKLTVTIKSGYTATLKIKSSGYSATRTINVSDATPASGTTSGQAVTSGAMSVSGIGELSFALNSGSHDLTVTGGTLYIAELDIEATALPAHTVTYMPGEGTGAEFIIDDDATEVSDGSTMFTAPEGKIFNGWKDGDNNDVEVGTIVTGDMTLTAQWINHYAVTFNMNGHGDAIDPQDIKEGAKATKPADPVVMGWDFGGWFTDAECTAGNEFDFESPITAATPLFAKWTEFDGCALLYPALSGDALHVGDNVALQTGSMGGAIAVVGMKEDGSMSYNANGLYFSGGSADVISVTLNSDMAVGTKISVTLVAANTGSRGLNLLNATGGSVAGGTKLGWDNATLGEVGTFSYTVTASDGLDGTNIFRLQRNNSVYLQCVKVESCGAAITYHNLTSEVNIAGKGTVTLGASSVREGYTTTAEYSDIDPLYEFVNWTVSGAGASLDDANANPVNVTMGTEDAVVTLNLQLKPVKYTVNYNDGATLMGSELVSVNEHPTAAGIETAKRHYTFQGWSETDGGSVVALNTITRTEATTVELYAKYEPVACPTSGTIFSMVFDDTKTPASTVKVAKNGGTLDAGEYATISGGTAKFVNTETSDKDAITTSGQFKLAATKEVMKIELECALQEGDIIRVPDNSNKYVISTSDSKTGTYQAQTSSQHEFAVTAAWAGVDDIYLLYDGSGWTFTEVEVYRPGKFDVSFNMMGHGTQIADIENVLEGSKISAPTAPTDANYSFAGWYKENTLANEWKFDVDVVEANTTLYAKWLDKSDATLKSLKYGETEIALEAGVFEYNIGLPAMTVAVPALTAETSNPSATKVIADAAAFDSEGNATSTVTITPEVGADQVYTVNFSKLAALPQVNVTEATTWNFSAGGSTTLTNQSDVVLANLPGINNDENFNSQALLGSFNKLEGTYFQGSKLSFTTEVAGKLTITFRGTNGNTRHLQVCVGDGETVVADWVYNSSSTSQTKTVFVPVGKVTLKAFEGETPNNARIYRMELNTTPDYTRPVTQGRYGTICLPNGGVMVGAMLYEVAYFGETSQKIFFDNIPSGEMEAGIPYVFLPNDGVSQLAVYYTDDANASAGNKNGLFGSYTEEVLTDYGNDYVLYNNQYLRVVDNGATVKVGANRAYIKLGEITPTAPALAPGRIRMAIGVTGHNTPTGVENVQGDNVQNTKVLINGNLFILRGEKMFDATGRLVK